MLITEQKIANKIGVNSILFVLLLCLQTTMKTIKLARIVNSAANNNNFPIHN